ncbi:MAG: hypothetical protein R3F20_19315 [Planctomycetota bacterium]
MSSSMIRLGVLLALSLVARAPAQVVFVGHGGLPSGNVESAYLPTAAYPVGASAVPAFPTPLPNASTMPLPACVYCGGMASDDRNAWIYTTNGQLMTMDKDPNFNVFGYTANAPFAGTQPITNPYGSFPPLEVTGLAFDDAGNRLWACDTQNFWPLNALPPFNHQAAPLPIPGLSGGIATGLGFESSTGTLWACTDQGFIYHFTTAGVAIGAQPVATTIAVAPLGGLTVSNHNHAGAFAPPACSTQIPGFHVSVTDGIHLYDAFNAAPPIPLLGGGPQLAWGLTSSADYQVSICPPIPGTVCSSGNQPFTGLRQPAITGPGLFNAIRLVNAPPLTPVKLLVDLCPANSCWWGLMMNPFTMTTLNYTTDSSGNLNVGFFIGGFLPGFQFSHQFAIPDPNAPLTYCFSNVSTTTVALP